MNLNPLNWFRQQPDPLRDLREQIEKKTLELQVKLLETTAAGPNWMGNVVDPYEPLFDDLGFWMPLYAGDRLPPTLDKTNRGELLPVYITWYGLKIIRDISRRLCLFNEFAINVLENRVSYTCGRGFQYKLVPKDGKDTADVLFLAKLGQRWVDMFSSSQCWNEKEQEIIRRCDRDGEMFGRFFHVGNGHTEFRIVEPEWIRSPDERDWETYGIVNEPNDVGDVVGYWVIDSPPYQAPNFVPAEEIIHIKGHLAHDSTSKRGLPTLFPVRKNLARVEKLLQNMSTLASVQSMFAVIRKWKQYSGAQVTGFQQANSDFQWTNPSTGNTQFSKMYSPGSIVDYPENVDVQFPSSTVNASALVQCIQAELRAVAAACQMPEFLISADASNNNYASIQITESPFVKVMERTQAFFARRFGDGACVKVKNAGAMWRVLANAVDYGGLPREVLTDCELQVEGPSLIGREKATETQRMAMLSQAGIISRGTWAKLEGFDAEQEEKQINQEMQKQLAQQQLLQQSQIAAAQQQAVQQMALPGASPAGAGVDQLRPAQATNPMDQQELQAPQSVPMVPGADQGTPILGAESVEGRTRFIRPLVKAEQPGLTPDSIVMIDWVLDDPTVGISSTNRTKFTVKALIENGFSGGVTDVDTGKSYTIVDGMESQLDKSKLIFDRFKHRWVRPGEPEGRSAPVAAPFQMPPRPKGQRGLIRPGGYSATGETVTKLGDLGEQISEKFGLRALRPEGPRQGPFDRMFASNSRWVAEVKLLTTHAAEYKTKLRAVDARAKIQYAREHRLVPTTVLVILDPEAKRAYGYWRLGIGSWNLTPGTSGNWSFLGVISV